MVCPVSVFSFFSTFGAGLVILPFTVSAATYQLKASFQANNWLSEFSFGTDDYNHGFVNYLDAHDAQNSKLFTTTQDGDVMFGIDSTETLKDTDKGRKSIKLVGSTVYNHGLFILDVKSMPGACGAWPAFWALGAESWPQQGEIDIVEGINMQASNLYTMHTDTQCTFSTADQTGTLTNSNCALDTGGGVGCTITDGRLNSFGVGFQGSTGGYYAMEWTSQAIKMWFFPRNSTIPSSLTTSNPDTSNFGKPAANFQGSGCDIDQRFKNLSFVFSNNLCGDWAGEQYGRSSCPQYQDSNGNTLGSWDSCKQYVMNNPRAFAAKWKIASFKTFQKQSSSPSSSSKPSSTSSISKHSSTHSSAR